MEHIMHSQILHELKVLSDRVATIQDEISILSRQFSDHISNCQSTNAECLARKSIANEDSKRPTENSDHENTCILSCKDQTLEKSLNCNSCQSSPKEDCQSKGTDARKTRAGENGATPSNTGHVDIATNEREKDVHLLCRKGSKKIKQDCLRKAIQQNIVLLVDNLSCSETEIIDTMIASDCLTETESSDLRRNGSKKDCVRNLIRIVRGRSYNVLKTFVKCVENFHPDVAESISQVYEKLMKDRKNYIKRCTFCDLKTSDSIKMVADHLWGIDAISDSLYDEIVSENKSREELWEKLADEVNRGNAHHNALKKLSRVLAERGHYKDLSLKLSKMSFLKCMCFKENSSIKTEGQLTLNILVTDVDEMSTASPLSTPTSSLSLVDETENEDWFVADDNSPANKHENYFLSPRAAVRDKQDSSIGLRKSLTFSQNTIDLAVEFRAARSNSFGKSSNIRGRSQTLANRRASMFI
ncbi:uncharacterized protein LOC132759397 [Ruditapes philippinarum]|uniref:uncharacterized protein LOC132759397 n=1 Tax=Ruditapes philippinarum TaxID=129788 RepID=UPI00295B3D8D|nr:uncharacterized protein LOC132759397 [Ruditapes philippinarum]